jgi:hypothetical protein
MPILEILLFILTHLLLKNIFEIVFVQHEPIIHALIPFYKFPGAQKRE